MGRNRSTKLYNNHISISLLLVTPLLLSSLKYCIKNRQKWLPNNGCCQIMLTKLHRSVYHSHLTCRSLWRFCWRIWQRVGNWRCHQAILHFSLEKIFSVLLLSSHLFFNAESCLRTIFSISFSSVEFIVGGKDSATLSRACLYLTSQLSGCFSINRENS